MKIYTAYMADPNGEALIETFASEEAMMQYVKADVKKVTEILKEDGYKPIVEEKPDYIYVYTEGIYYKWEMFESELRESGEYQ